MLWLKEMHDLHLTDHVTARASLCWIKMTINTRKDYFKCILHWFPSVYALEFQFISNQDYLCVGMQLFLRHFEILWFIK